MKIVELAVILTDLAAAPDFWQLQENVFVNVSPLRVTGISKLPESAGKITPSFTENVILFAFLDIVIPLADLISPIVKFGLETSPFMTLTSV